MNIKVSKGNSKMGDIPSISLPAGITCRNDCECNQKCYARRIERLRKSAHKAYEHNYKLLNNSPDIFWREVEASIMMSRFFRFHVSGDIPNAAYLRRMISVSAANPHCQILCFTKRYSMVNDYIAAGQVIPDNLHLVFSVWRNLTCCNPFSLPEAHVRYRDGTTTAGDNAVECGGNCTECAITDGGCWTLRRGEQVVFNEH